LETLQRETVVIYTYILTKVSIVTSLKINPKSYT
jgi:hypothetical protein